MTESAIVVRRSVCMLIIVAICPWAGCNSPVVENAPAPKQPINGQLEKGESEVMSDESARPVHRAPETRDSDLSKASSGVEFPDYFPAEPGSIWNYEIKASQDGLDALDYEENVWPSGERSVVYATRKRLFSRSHAEHQDKSDPPSRIHHLEIRVKQTAAKQGPLSYANGVEIDIPRDDLGIFSDTISVFWAVSPRQVGPLGGRFHVIQVKVYAGANRPGGHWGIEPGHSTRWLFFAGRAGIAISKPKSPEELLFQGADELTPDSEYKDCLHFVRHVLSSPEDAGEKEPSDLDHGFIEDYWFSRNVGLVRLTQTVDGQRTMEWSLKSFTPGGMVPRDNRSERNLEGSESSRAKANETGGGSY